MKKQCGAVVRKPTILGVTLAGVLQDGLAGWRCTLVAPDGGLLIFQEFCKLGVKHPLKKTKLYQVIIKQVLFLKQP